MIYRINSLICDILKLLTAILEDLNAGQDDSRVQITICLILLGLQVQFTNVHEHM